MDHRGETRCARTGISAIVPVADGQVRLEAALLDLAAVLDGLVGSEFDISVVDAASPDRATAAVDDLVAARPHLPLRAGADHTTARRELVAIISPEFDARELSHVLEALDDETDLVIGYRLHPGSLLSQLKIRTRNLLVNAYFGYTARDVDCAFKLLRQRAWEDITSRMDGGWVGAELVVAARRLGYRVKEVPLEHYAPRVGSTRRNRSGAAGVMPSEARTHA